MADLQENSIIPQKEVVPSFWSQHRLLLLLIGSLLIAIAMTVISVILYTKSGAAQLDLSRPGYRAVSSQVERDKDTDQYSGIGPVNSETIQEFIDLYKKRAEQTKSVDAFSGDPLNPEVLVFGYSEEQ